MNITLYKLMEEFKAKTLAYESAENEAEELVSFDELKNLDISIKDKLSNCCAYVKNLEAEVTKVHQHIGYLKAKKEKAEGKLEFFTKYLESLLNENQSWTDGLHTISWRKSEIVEVIDEDLIPEQFMKVKDIRTPDKLDIKAHLKIGAKIPGVQLTKKNNMSVK